MSKVRLPGIIPKSFVYRDYETVLDKLLLNAGMARDFHFQYENDAPHIVKEAEATWGLHPLGYQYGYHSTGSNWHLPGASAYISIWNTGHNKGKVAVIIDLEKDEENHGLFFRLSDGTVIPQKRMRGDIHGWAVAYIEYGNKPEFLQALSEADILVRDNETNEAIYALAALNVPTRRSRCP